MVRARFAARDPGGANVLAGFLARHAARLPAPYDVWTLPRAASVFAQAGLSCRLFPEEVDPSVIQEAWNECPATALITGTSHYAPFESLLWRAAQPTGAPSLALNDSWMNLAARFDRGHPEWVGAVDAGQVDELVALGFPRARILLTGHPWLSSLLERRETILAGTPVPSRNEGVRALFVSEPIASDVAAGVNRPFGFDEFDSFQLLWRAAAGVAAAGTPVTVAVKFHPYENPRPFLERAARLPVFPGLRLELLELREKPHPWILWADLVVGISSMLLLEAIVLGRPVISLQPELMREETFIATRRGFAQTLVDPATAVPTLAQLLREEPARRQVLAQNRGFLGSLPSDPHAPILGWLQRTLAG